MRGPWRGRGRRRGSRGRGNLGGKRRRSQRRRIKGVDLHGAVRQTPLGSLHKRRWRRLTTPFSLKPRKLPRNQKRFHARYRGSSHCPKKGGGVSRGDHGQRRGSKRRRRGGYAHTSEQPGPCHHTTREQPEPSAGCGPARPEQWWQCRRRGGRCRGEWTLAFGPVFREIHRHRSPSYPGSDCVVAVHSPLQKPHAPRPVTRMAGTRSKKRSCVGVGEGRVSMPLFLTRTDPTLTRSRAEHAHRRVAPSWWHDDEGTLSAERLLW
jgi:hypothetical protein